MRSYKEEWIRWYNCHLDSSVWWRLDRAEAEQREEAKRKYGYFYLGAEAEKL
jgi:hypothetical protein